jgi:hypothetical protein
MPMRIDPGTIDRIARPVYSGADTYSFSSKTRRTHEELTLVDIGCCTRYGRQLHAVVLYSPKAPPALGRDVNVRTCVPAHQPGYMSVEEQQGQGNLHLLDQWYRIILELFYSGMTVIESNYERPRL